MVSTICNGSLPSLFFALHELDSTAKKTHDSSTSNNWSANIYENEKCGNYYTHNFLSKTPYSVHNNTNGSAFNQFSQASITRNTSLVNKDFLALISDSPSSRDSGENIFLDLFSVFSDISH